VRLAKGLADEAAMAITNAHLFEQIREQGKGLQARVAHLEHPAETLAHDLRVPGERMGEFATLLVKEYGDRFDERATRWLRSIEENGRLLRERVEDILAIARIGGAERRCRGGGPGVGHPGRPEVAHGRDGTAGDPGACGWRATADRMPSGLPVPDRRQSGIECREVFRRLSCGSRGGREERVRFSVFDTGIGISESERIRVFEPFVRLHPATTPGSGIGLAIVRRIVDLYDGEVWIEPNAPTGSTVSLTLPVLGNFAPRELSKAVHEK
jgi:signal transduction histidine kinase